MIVTPWFAKVTFGDPTGKATAEAAGWELNIRVESAAVPRSRLDGRYLCSISPAQVVRSYPRLDEYVVRAFRHTASPSQSPECHFCLSEARQVSQRTGQARLLLQDKKILFGGGSSNASASWPHFRRAHWLFLFNFNFLGIPSLIERLYLRAKSHGCFTTSNTSRLQAVFSRDLGGTQRHHS